MNSYKITPIFSAIDDRDIDSIRRILETSPTSARYMDIYGITAFAHEATSRGNSDILRVMFDFDPDILSVQADALGIVQQTFSWSIDKSMFLLGKLDPSTINAAGENVLHLALRSNNTNIVNFIVTRFPWLARQADAFGRFPLHQAFVHARTNCTTSMYIYDVFTDAVVATDRDGRNPIHYAYDFDLFIVEERDECFIDRVIEKNPVCLLQKSKLFGETPVMLNLMSRSPDVRMFIKYAPESLLVTNSQQENVLHILAKHKPRQWTSTAKKIVAVYPHLLYGVSNGKTPIDFACESIGREKYKNAKEEFLVMCLAHGHITDSNWKTFLQPCHALLSVIPVLLEQRRFLEVRRAIKLLPVRDGDFIRQVILCLNSSVFGQLERELVACIVAKSI